MSEINQQKILFFTPDKWGEATKFRKFYTSSYHTFNKPVQAAVHGVEAHFDKFILLNNLVNRLLPNLIEEEKELKERGFTSAIYSKELAAIIETMFVELYSSINCTKQILGAIYGRFKGITTKKTRNLFKNAKENKIDERVPIAIREALAKSDWFEDLRKIRDTIIHFNVGFCSKDKDGRLNYLHPDIGESNKAFIIEDVLKEMSKYAKKVNEFLGIVFHTLNKTLSSKETTQLCGIFYGRGYQRKVSFQENLNFDSGKCISYTWFEKDNKFMCPFKNDCGAYSKAKEDI